MLCPECEEEMAILEWRGVEVDFCTECEGIWLDEGELELLVPPESEKASSIAAALDEPSPPKGAGDRKCPVCGKRMALVDIPITRGNDNQESFVEVDKCPRKHGLWFDKGELQTIISSSGEPVSDFLSELFGVNSENSSEP